MTALVDDVKVYTVNGANSGSSSALPDWLTRKRALSKKRTKKEKVETTLQLIQNFEFPEASIKIRTTRDGNHAIATGVYKPQMRVWDLHQLTLKFERHTDAENVDFVVSTWRVCRLVISLTIAKYRYYPMIGLKHYTSKQTALSNSIPNKDSITELEYLELAGRSPITFPRVTRTLAALEQKSIV
jgi:hypothetical protein